MANHLIIVQKKKPLISASISGQALTLCIVAGRVQHPRAARRLAGLVSRALQLRQDEVVPLDQLLQLDQPVLLLLQRILNRRRPLAKTERAGKINKAQSQQAKPYLMVSATCTGLEEQATSIVVLQLPPSESASSDVNIESRYGTCDTS